MDHWVMCHRLNLQESMWQNSKENHFMIDPKTGYTSGKYHALIAGVTVFGGTSK
jgi:hypothetical protein